MVSPKSLKNLRPWVPGQRGTQTGIKRGPRLVSTLLTELKDEGYRHVSKSDVQQVYQFLLSVDETRLKELAKDKDQPWLISTIARSMTASEAGYVILESMLDRVHGRPKQTEEISGDVDITINHRILNVNTP